MRLDEFAHGKVDGLDLSQMKIYDADGKCNGTLAEVADRYLRMKELYHVVANHIDCVGSWQVDFPIPFRSGAHIIPPDQDKIGALGIEMTLVFAKQSDNIEIERSNDLSRLLLHGKGSHFGHASPL